MQEWKVIGSFGDKGEILASGNKRILRLPDIPDIHYDFKPEMVKPRFEEWSEVEDGQNPLLLGC